MAKYVFFTLLLFLTINTFCQEALYVDSLTKELSKTNDLNKKIELLDQLSLVLMNTNLEGAEKYGKELIQLAERSRDREAMVKAYISNGARCGFWAGNKDYTNRSLDFFDQAIKIAKENKLTKYEVEALVKQAGVLLSVPDYEKASRFLDQAASLSSVLKNDSTEVQIALTRGNISLAKNEKIEALRSYLIALRLSEKIGNSALERKCYLKLSGFYSSIEDFDRAIDYYTLGMNKLVDIKGGNILLQKVNDIKDLGDLYAQKKSYELAIKHYEESIGLADSLKFPTLKMPGYIGLLNVYLFMKEPRRAMDFIDSKQGTKLKDYLIQLGMSPIVDQAYAIIYSEMGNLDSAGKYFQSSASFFNNSQNIRMKISNNFQTAYYLKRKGENKQAINILLNTKSIAEATGQLEVALESSKYLDTLYGLTGDFKQSKYFSSEYYLYKDSLQKINKEKELIQVEAQDEQLRQQKATEDALEKKRRRNNIQYLAITLGIATLFLAMVLLGMFRVSAGTIKMVGFFAFLMFFEFIFLIFKKNIYAITHGEPWMDLLFMIGLAAILLPLHHWLEHKVLHYLTTQNKLTTAGSAFRNRFFNKPDEKN